MIKNYLTVSLRTLLKHRGYSFINIFGLAVGMAACILILLFVRDELSYDRYHEKADRIYRVSRQWMNPQGEISLHLGHAAPPYGPLLKNDFPNYVEESVRLLQDSPLVSYGELDVVESRFFYADSSFFDVFSFPMLRGDPGAALAEPNGLVVTESTAKRYFGDENPLGKVVRLRGATDVKVTGVVRDVPLNSHFKFDMLASFRLVEEFFGRDNMMQNWGNNSYSTFLLLREGADPAELARRFPAFIDRHQPGDGGQKTSEGTQLNLWPLTDIHLRSNLDSEIEANGDIAYVYIYSAIALFILLIACINFMNLSTARAAQRAREVGVRKALGADRGALVRQFLGESLLLSAVGLVVAVALVELALPGFNAFVGKDLGLLFSKNAPVLLALVPVVGIVGVLAGSYPAFYLSAFEATRVLKGVQESEGRGGSFRSALVVTQFAITIALIVSVGVVYQQLSFVRSKNLGFDKERVVVLPTSAQIRSQFPSVKAQLLAHPGISAVTTSSRVPSGRLLDSQGGTAEIDGELQVVQARVADIHVEHEFFRTYGIPVVAGRDFDLGLASDSTEAFVLNRAAVGAIGWEDAEEAVGKQFQYGGRRGRIIGVVEDFHFESLHQRIAPIVFLISPRRFNNVSLRIRPGEVPETMAYLRERWAEWRPDYPFQPIFVDDNFDQLYQAEERLAGVFGFFALLAILIACLGLLGLASYATQRRTKEIGVRKVLGASVPDILMLLSRDFTRLVLVAFVVAAPVAWLAMNRWLEGFAYRISLGIGVFLLAGLLAFAIALLTVSYLSLKAAVSDPVKSLRYE